MILLDTNVLSEVMRPRGTQTVVDWLDAQPTADTALASITVAEILHGMARLPNGQRRRTLYALATSMFERDFAGRIFSFDRAAAIHYAEVITARERIGRPITMADAQIAAIARAHGATLATRNTRDFDDLALDLIDPWQA